MNMVDPSSIIACFLLAFGIFYYRRKYLKLKESLKPKPQPKSPQQLKREEYEAIRNQVLLRDGFRCQECGFKYKLEVHHIIPRSQGGSNDPSNLITLCKKCHDKHHPDRHPRQKIHRKSKRRKHKHRHGFNRNNCPAERLKVVDESDFLEPIGKISSPERRDALYKKWMSNELNQTNKKEDFHE